ncbi:MAG: hemolysin III family protein [Desulfuromonadaceae bacterium]
MLPVIQKRAQSRGEEMANGISHGLGVIIAIVATPFLIIQTLRTGDVGFVVGVSVFCVTIVLLYLSSTIYHFLHHGRGKRVFHILDHTSIFLLIAGSYTPFALGVLKGWLGWTLFGTTWGIAAVGIVLKSVPGARHPILSTTLYLFMGWIIVFAVKPLIALAPMAAVWWLVSGGFFYTLGVVFFALDSCFKYSHFVWHIFVLAGTACHYIAVYSCVV